MLQHYIITYVSDILMIFGKVTQHLLRELSSPCLEEIAKHCLNNLPKMNVIKSYILKEPYILRRTWVGLGK